jgi:hypothetical protein
MPRHRLLRASLAATSALVACPAPGLAGPLNALLPTRIECVASARWSDDGGVAYRNQVPRASDAEAELAWFAGIWLTWRLGGGSRAEEALRDAFAPIAPPATPAAADEAAASQEPVPQPDQGMPPSPFEAAP